MVADGQKISCRLAAALVVKPPSKISCESAVALEAGALKSSVDQLMWRASAVIAEETRSTQLMPFEDVPVPNEKQRMVIMYQLTDVAWSGSREEQKTIKNRYLQIVPWLVASGQ